MSMEIILNWVSIICGDLRGGLSTTTGSTLLLVITG